MKHRSKSDTILERENQSPKIPSKSDLGGSWAPFGRGLAQSWASLGRSWAPLGRVLGVQDRGFLEHGSKMGSKRPLGSILNRFGVVGGGFGEDFRNCSTLLGGFWEGFWSLTVLPFWENLE